ncbi:MAG: hypothetical protein A2W03_15720 [Candidatus Aminicenantes bacterium RBG_16_63_16]|nr:MAG: hypothetical protein A2W03_15720 [Candidatus Aminicenantes bacterium RBG_16_63_16]
MTKPDLGFKIWTAALSVFVAVMLLPNILHKHGLGKSLLITGLAVGAIWLMYFVIGRLINGVVAKELKRRAAESDGRRPDESDRQGGLP